MAASGLESVRSSMRKASGRYLAGPAEPARGARCQVPGANKRTFMGFDNSTDRGQDYPA